MLIDLIFDALFTKLPRWLQWLLGASLALLLAGGFATWWFTR
jgi:hypothetical protein